MSSLLNVLAGAALAALSPSDAAAQRQYVPGDSVAISAAAGDPAARRQGARSWLAGDHHIHSQYSVGWDETTDPPTPIVAGDAIYPIPTNAEMAKRHGLSWMVSTDHGGPNHSKVNLELAYPELLESREAVPGLIQFYGMEFDTPAAEHSSLIIPHSHEEHETLYDIESRFARREPFPPDSTRDTEAAMLDALAYMKHLPLPLCCLPTTPLARPPVSAYTAAIHHVSCEIGTIRRRGWRWGWRAHRDTRRTPSQRMDPSIRKALAGATRTIRRWAASIK